MRAAGNESETDALSRENSNQFESWNFILSLAPLREGPFSVQNPPPATVTNVRGSESTVRKWLDN